jgi:hypothetical protein
MCSGYPYSGCPWGGYGYSNGGGYGSGGVYIGEYVGGYNSGSGFGYGGGAFRAVQRVVVSSARGDVTGDGIPDYVYLTAVKADPSSPFLQRIALHVRDGATQQDDVVPLDDDGNAGYNPTLFLGDFTGNGVSDILVSIDSGGSGAFTFDYIYSFEHRRARKLFDFNRYNEQHTYTVTYLDLYKVEVASPATGKTYLIDISDRGADYLSQIYNADGTLKKPIQGWADGVSGFYPVDIDRNGVYEVRAYQQLSGLYHADSLGYVVNTLQWDGSKFAVQQQWVAIFGTSRS